MYRMQITQRSALRIDLMTNPFVSKQLLHLRKRMNDVTVDKEYINYAQVFTNCF